MRSHVINQATETDEKLAKKKPSSGGTNANYGLRENPRKTSRFAASNEDSLLDDKFCKECGKGFQSWKALFGHMKCHSERFLWNSVEEDEITDNQSNNETATPNRKKKRSRRVTRYTGNSSSSFSMANNAASSSVSEIEQEQEEVAMCLMMLSRDVGNKGIGLNNSVTESSDNNFELLEAGSSSILSNPIGKTKGKNSLKKLEPSILESQNSQFDAKSGSKLSNPSVCFNGSVGNGKAKKARVEAELGDSRLVDLSEFGSRKELRIIASKKLGSGERFECTTCKKSFHSYQALGGHRASHKKMKGSCFASKINSSDNNSIETEISPAQIAEQELVVEPKKNKAHECPICLKVFSSGQALGGHKRSHLIAGSEAKTSQTGLIQKPMAEIRDLLDLNLPAPVEEEGSGLDGFKPWWISGSHKHEPLVGLISN